MFFSFKQRQKSHMHKALKKLMDDFRFLMPWTNLIMKITKLETDLTNEIS